MPHALRVIGDQSQRRSVRVTPANDIRVTALVTSSVPSDRHSEQRRLVWSGEGNRRVIYSRPMIMTPSGMPALEVTRFASTSCTNWSTMGYDIPEGCLEVVLGESRSMK